VTAPEITIETDGQLTDAALEALARLLLAAVEENESQEDAR
jgi:hypothetical protein